MTRRFVFIGGLHRSGTSLLARLLRSHPEVSGFVGTGVWEDEGQHLQSLVPSARELGGPGRFGSREGARLDENSSLRSPSAREQLLSEWGRYWDLDRPVLLEKSPPNLLRFRFLQAVFPSAHCIAIVRHPLAVALSTQRMRRLYRLRSVPSLVEHWALCHEQFEEDRGAVQRLHVVRYEDLIARPEAELASILDFLELSATPLAEPVRPDGNLRWEELWGSRGRLGRRRLARLEERVERLGYSLGGFGG